MTLSRRFLKSQKAELAIPQTTSNGSEKEADSGSLKNMAELVSEVFQNFESSSEKKKGKKLHGIMCLNSSGIRGSRINKEKDAKELFVHYKK